MLSMLMSVFCFSVILYDSQNFFHTKKKYLVTPE